MNFWASFWNIIWFFFWGFVFVAYLMALFTVIVDLFRDRDMSGWAKALWIVALVFVPFLTVLVYVIARGDGMAARSAKEQRSSQAATDEYIRRVASTGPADEIRSAKALLDDGSISRDEYETLKAKALREQGAKVPTLQHDTPATHMVG